jgi:ankyrin repeat protein
MSADNSIDLDSLHRAIKRGDVVGVRDYLRAGGSVSAKDRYGWTPILMAAKQGHTPIVRLLVEAGASVNESSSIDYTPLAAAAIAGSSETVAYLLDRGADPRVKYGRPLTELLRMYGEDRAVVLRLIEEALQRCANTV